MKHLIQLVGIACGVANGFVGIGLAAMGTHPDHSWWLTLLGILSLVGVGFIVQGATTLMERWP